MTTKTVLVAGAGVAGATLAYWLCKRGFAPTLLERAPEFRGGGYIIDFWGVGYDVAERMGLLPVLRARGYHVDQVRYVRADGGARSSIDPAALDRATGGRYLSLTRGDLARSIYERVAGDVETVYGDRIRVVAEDPDGVRVELASGATRRFDLVVGCDGVHSDLRRIVFGDAPDPERYLGYTVASVITRGYPVRDDGSYVSFAAPGRQISRYAMRDDETGFLFVWARDTPPTDLAAHDQRAQIAEILDVFAGDDWQELPMIRARLAEATELYFDTVTQVDAPAWSRGRVALLGDAAYAPSLLAGAGSAYAMLGAYVLAGELASAGGDHRAAYAAYEQRLRPFFTKKQADARRFASSFAPRSRIGLFLRDRALDLMHVPGLGPWMIRRMLRDNLAVPDYA